MVNNRLVKICHEKSIGLSSLWWGFLSKKVNRVSNCFKNVVSNFKMHQCQKYIFLILYLQVALSFDPTLILQSVRTATGIISNLVDHTKNFDDNKVKSIYYLKI